MDTRTGEIKSQDEIGSLSIAERKHFVQLTEEQHTKLSRMSRIERQRYYATHRKEFRDKGVSWSEFNEKSKGGELQNG